MRASTLSPLRLWQTLLVALCLAAAPELQAQCYSCLGGPTAPRGACTFMNYDGYVECVQTDEYCSGVLPRCFASLDLLVGDGSMLALLGESAAGDEPSTRDTRFSPGGGESPEMAQKRRACDGAIIGRSYPASAAAELRRSVKQLRI